MMDLPHARKQVGSALGVCHGAGQPETRPRTSIWSRKIASSERTFRPVCDFSEPERSTLAEIGKRARSRLGRVACVAKPDTILARYRRLIARKFDGSKYRASSGWPPSSPEVEALIAPLSGENSG